MTNIIQAQHRFKERALKAGWERAKDYAFSDKDFLDGYCCDNCGGDTPLNDSEGEQNE